MNTSYFQPLKPFFRFCGSIKLAMLLLAVIIVATVTGTLVESRLDTSVAQAYVYDAPWFMAWNVLLCVNLIGAVLVRYPFKPHQLGFVITHAGIVVILVGAMIGRIFGFEGSLTLFKDQPPANYLLTGKQMLQVKTASANKTHEMNLSRNLPSSERPEKFKAGDLEIAALEFAPELALKTRIEKTDSKGAPALRLVMNSAFMRQPLDHWFLLDDSRHGQFEFGPSIIRYVSGEPATEPNPNVSETKQVPSRELHFAFAKMPGMNIARPSAGGATGIQTTYEFNREQSGENGKGKIELKTDAGTFSFAVSELLGRETPLPGTPWKIKFLEYFADLRMQGKKPVSVSDQPNNPAVLFEILGPLVAENSVDEATHQHDGHQHDGHQHAASPTKSGLAELTIFRDAKGQLRFQSRSAKTKAGLQGEIKVGEEFFPGLADWKCRVEEIAEHAIARQELAPLSDDAPQSIGASGLLVQTKKGASSDTRWIRMGTPTQFNFAGENIELNFGHKLHSLDFTVALEKFEVEMNEGTQNPAGFKSHVRFHDPKKETTLTRAVWMNHPANFPQFAGAGLLGTSYKFSQSSWNPNNLDETTLQVIRDPGWSLKWIGSLLLCGGLFTMFYLKPYPRFARQKEAASKPASAPPIFTPERNPEEVLIGK